MASLAQTRIARARAASTIMNASILTRPAVEDGAAPAAEGVVLAIPAVGVPKSTGLNSAGSAASLTS